MMVGYWCETCREVVGRLHRHEPKRPEHCGYGGIVNPPVTNREKQTTSTIGHLRTLNLQPFVSTPSVFWMPIMLGKAVAPK